MVRDKALPVLLIATIENLAIFPLLLGVAEPEWHAINVYASILVGLNLNYVLVFTVAWIVSMMFLIILLVKIISHNLLKKVFHVNTLQIITWIIVIIAWNVFFGFFCSIAGEAVLIIGKWFDATSIIWYACINAVLAFLGISLLPRAFNRLRASRDKNTTIRSKAFFIITILFAGYAGGLSLVILEPPTTVSSDPIPPRPLLIGHRGAGHLGPENTINLANEMLSLDIAGWEVDVQVSIDGTYFLLHDDNFRRTTNVESVYPDRAGNLACTFTYAEIQALDAGSWFVQEDPYLTIASGVVSRDVAESYRGCKIPTLQDAITFSETHGLILDVDSKTPPDSHPFRATFREGIVNLLNASSLGKNAWVYTSSPDATNLTRVCGTGCTVEKVLARGYNLVNSGPGITSTEITDLINHGIPVVVYTIDDVLSFSTLWSSGVTYIKSNRPWIFAELQAPVGHMTCKDYAFFWIAFFSLIGGLAVVISFWGKKNKH